MRGELASGARSEIFEDDTSSIIEDEDEDEQEGAGVPVEAEADAPLDRCLSVCILANGVYCAQ